MIEQAEAAEIAAAEQRRYEAAYSSTTGTVTAEDLQNVITQIQADFPNVLTATSTSWSSGWNTPTRQLEIPVEPVTPTVPRALSWTFQAQMDVPTFRAFGNFLTTGLTADRQRKSANRRAMGLLLSMLTPVQKRQRRRTRFKAFGVIGSNGGEYVLDEAGVYQSGSERIGGGHTIEHWCLQSVPMLPYADVILMKKLLLEGDEDRFRSTAIPSTVAWGPRGKFWDRAFLYPKEVLEERELAKGA